MKKFNLSTWLLFLIPSILGIIIIYDSIENLMVNGKYRLQHWLILLSGAVAPVMPWTATIILIIAALGSIVYLFQKKNDGKSIIY